MIKSKILYGLCVAALGLPFAEAMDRKLPNVGDNGVEKLDRTPYSRFDEQKPVCKVEDNKPTFDSLFVKTFKEKLNRYLHSYKSRNQVVLKGGNVDNDSLVRYGQGGIKRQASQAECPKKKDNSTSDISQFSSSSNSERERPTNTLIPEIETGQQLDALSQPVCDLTEEDVHNDETIKGKAKKLLKAIDNPSYDKNKREKLENELQALGVCRTNAEYGDDLLKIQLDVFLNPHKPEYEDWPRNDYNEIVWKGKIGVQLTHKENEWLEYLLSVCETNFEIVATFKNVFMREIDESCVRKQRYKNSKESQKKASCKGVFCEEDFNKAATTLRLTEFEKNRLIRSIRGYKESKKKLAAFLSKGGYKDEDISSIFKRLYNKTYCSQTISNWEKEKSSPEELAKEINALWTYQPSVDSEKDREKCDFVKVLLKDCGFEVQNDNNIIYNTNCRRNMTNNQANVQLQENNVYIDNVQNDYINNNVTGIEIKQNDRVILPALDSLLKTIESNNNINNDQNDYMNNNVIEFEQDNNNFNNNWNYNSGTSCNNSDQTIFSKQINMSDNSNYLQEMINNQINTQSKEDGGYIDNEYVETGDEYNLLEFEEETGFMQNRYYSNYEF